MFNQGTAAVPEVMVLTSKPFSTIFQNSLSPTFHENPVLWATSQNRKFRGNVESDSFSSPSILQYLGESQSGISGVSLFPSVDLKMIRVLLRAAV